MSRVLAFSCCHAPALHPKFVSFLKGIHKKHKCNRVVNLGDMVDWHAINFHEKDPSLPSASEEYKQARKQVAQISKAFPVVDYMRGNHCDLPGRKARSIGLPDEVLADFKTLWSLPKGWTIHDRYADLVIDDVIYRHGDKCKGGSRIAAMANAKDEHKSLVQGHLHAQFGVEFAANHDRIIFGAQTGCGTEPGHAAMKYSRVYSARPILGCIVVINGEPVPERMKL